MKGVWKSAWISLWRKKLRTWLTISSIAIGTAMVVLILSIGQIGTAAVNRELETMGMDGLSISNAEGLSDRALELVRSIPTVRLAMPLSLEFAAVMTEGTTHSVVACGIDAGAEQAISLELLHGRMLTRADVLGEQPVCVVDEAMAYAVFGYSNVVGRSFTTVYEGGTAELTVVGVSATGSSLLQNVTALIPYMVYLPYTTQQRVTGSVSFDQIAVRLIDSSSSEETASLIRGALLRSGEITGQLTTEDLASQRNRLGSMLDVVTLALTAIGGVSLLVSGFGILTVMLSSVNERTREIGIKKAIGATRKRVMAEFLAGAFLISLFGAGLGLALGCGAVVIGCAIMGTPPLFSPIQLGGVVLLTLVLGTLFGAYPAYQAAGMRPVEALRYDG